MEWWKIVGIIIAVLVLFFLGYYFLQENSQKYYQKAKRAHKKGEKAYASGNFELAETSYTLAEEHRKRARELE